MALAEPALLETVLEDLVGPPLPLEAGRAWHVFGELHATRSAGMGGVSAITYGEMAAHRQLTGVRLTPLEVTLIREADSVFLRHAATQMRAERPPTSTLDPED